MGFPRPSRYWNFANTSGYFDPRLTISRASVASYVDKYGRISTVPAGAPRWNHDPLTGECFGIEIESQRTNLLLRSEEFDNASWTKTNCSITADSVTSPEGNTNADTVIVSTTDGDVAQAVSITVGNAIAFSVFAKAATSNFVRLRLTDGSNSVQAWYNLSAGTVGTYTSGATTCMYSATRMTKFDNGWYRCVVIVSTTVSSTFTASIAPSASDNTSPAASDSVYIWGAQLESPDVAAAETSYIETTSAQVTRNADNVVYTDINSDWFNSSEGTIFLEVVNQPNATTTSAGSMVYGGIGDTFNNTVYMSRSGASSLSVSIRSGGSGVTMSKSQALVSGEKIKAAFSWKANQGLFVIDGGTVSSSVVTVPTTTARMTIGLPPWGASSTGPSVFKGNMRSFAYFPRALTAAELQVITS